MSWSIKQFARHDLAKVAQDLRMTTWVKAVTSIVDRKALELKAAGIPSHLLTLFKHNDVRQATLR
jgi:hypothetical protein